MKGFRGLLTADSAFNLGKISGIQFRIHYSWFVIFALVIYTLSGEYFPELYPEWTLPAYMVSGIIAALVFFASVVCHELAHSFVARSNSMPVKSITLFIFGGVAQITREAARARAELVMAAAGPACSFLIAGFFGALWFFTQGMSEHVSAVLFWLAWINVGLAVFNLVPGFPLDGGRIFHALLWHFSGNYRRSIRVATLVGQGIGYLFIVGGVLLGFLLQDWSWLWLALVGWFLAGAASASYRNIRGREHLVGLTASKVMTGNYQVVPANVTVERLMQEQKLLSENLVFLVADEGALSGMVTVQSIQDVAFDRRGVTAVKDIMAQGFPVVQPEDDVISIMEQMDKSGRSQVAVVSEGRVVGIIARDALIKLL